MASTTTCRGLTTGLTDNDATPEPLPCTQGCVFRNRQIESQQLQERRNEALCRSKAEIRTRKFLWVRLGRIALAGEVPGARRHLQSGRSLWFSAISAWFIRDFRGKLECPLLKAAVQGRSTLTLFVRSDPGYYRSACCAAENFSKKIFYGCEGRTLLIPPTPPLRQSIRQGGHLSSASTPSGLREATPRGSQQRNCAPLFAAHQKGSKWLNQLGLRGSKTRPNGAK